jgi:hypothetical protein
MTDSLPKRRDRHTAPQSSGDCHSYLWPFCLQPFPIMAMTMEKVAGYGKLYPAEARGMPSRGFLLQVSRKKVTGIHH